MNDRPPLEWKVVHELKGSDGTILRIQRRGDIRPLYSFQIGQERRPDPDGGPPANRLLPFVRVKVQAQGTISIDRAPEELVRKALDWIHEDAMQYEENYADRMHDRDSTRNGDMRRTGKTERNRNKRRTGGRD